MRKTPALEALFTPPVRGVLTATFMQPTKWWYMSDLARQLGLRPSSLQRPLAALVGAGILNRKREGNRVYFRPEQDSPLFRDLQGVVAKTAGIVEVMREALEPFRTRIKAAFVYGSIARSLERPQSDIDLMIIGSIGLADIAPALHPVETKLGRPINASVYSSEEFGRKRSAKSHFIQSVLDREKLFIVGRENDLGGTRAGRSRRAPQDQQAGARRPARSG